MREFTKGYRKMLGNLPQWQDVYAEVEPPDVLLDLMRDRPRRSHMPVKWYAVRLHDVLLQTQANGGDVPAITQKYRDEIHILCDAGYLKKVKTQYASKYVLTKRGWALVKGWA